MEKEVAQIDKEKDSVLALARTARNIASVIARRTRRIAEVKDTKAESRDPDGSIIDELLVLIEELETIGSQTLRLIPPEE